MPNVSVIMPVCNTDEGFLRQSIESLLLQTFTDFELIIVNDGSSAETSALLREYETKDSRIILLSHQTNKGTAVARNEGIRLSKGEYISFVDSDDVVDSNFLHELYNTITTHNADISCCDFYKITSSSIASPKHEYNPKISCSVTPMEDIINNKKQISFNVWNKLYKKSVLNDITFDENNLFEDWVFISMLLPKANSICWSSLKLYGYRIHDNSTMRSEFTIAKADSYLNGIKKVYYYYQNNYPQYLQYMRQTRLAQSLKMLINRAIKSQKREIKNYTKQKVKEMYSDGIIGYHGLSLKNKFRLWKILH